MGKEARIRERQYQVSLAAVGDGVCILDPDARVVYCNQALGTAKEQAKLWSEEPEAHTAAPTP